VSRPLEALRLLRDRVVAAGAGKAPDRELAAYLAKVATDATAITDDEVKALLAAGHGEDEIFEATIGVALTASIDRFEAGLRALDGVEEEKG
jgi:alkylhydroperoxidase family enzyme